MISSQEDHWAAVEESAKAIQVHASMALSILPKDKVAAYDSIVSLRALALHLSHRYNAAILDRILRDNRVVYLRSTKEVYLYKGSHEDTLHFCHVNRKNHIQVRVEEISDDSFSGENFYFKVGLPGD